MSMFSHITTESLNNNSNTISDLIADLMKMLPYKYTLTNGYKFYDHTPKDPITEESGAVVITQNGADLSDIAPKDQTIPGLLKAKTLVITECTNIIFEKINAEMVLILGGDTITIKECTAKYILAFGTQHIQIRNTKCDVAVGVVKQFDAFNTHVGSAIMCHDYSLIDDNTVVMGEGLFWTPDHGTMCVTEDKEVHISPEPQFLAKGIYCNLQNWVWMGMQFNKKSPTIPSMFNRSWDDHHPVFDLMNSDTHFEWMYSSDRTPTYDSFVEEYNAITGTTEKERQEKIHEWYKNRKNSFWEDIVDGVTSIQEFFLGCAETVKEKVDGVIDYVLFNESPSPEDEKEDKKQDDTTSAKEEETVAEEPITPVDDTQKPRMNAYVKRHTDAIVTPPSTQEVEEEEDVNNTEEGDIDPFAKDPNPTSPVIPDILPQQGTVTQEQLQASGFGKLLGEDITEAYVVQQPMIKKPGVSVTED